MFLDILEFTVESKKKLLRENCLKMGSQKLRKIVEKSTKLLLEKSAKTKITKNNEKI